jgi:hypothetical protein
VYTREDISLEDRMEIFSLYWRYQDEQGWTTELARRFSTSRHFIYQIAERVGKALDWQPAGRKSADETKRQCKLLQERVYALEAECEQLRGEIAIKQHDEQRRQMALLLELALCPVSEDKIVRCLHSAFGVQPSSGWVHQQLARAGEAALELMQRTEVKGVLEEAALDELFHHQRPILSLVDPHSLMMVVPKWAENRQGATWQQELAQYPELLLAVSDQGRGLRKGVELNGTGIKHQADLFHFKRNLRRAVRRLENYCYGAIARVEQARLVIAKPRLLDSARIQAQIEYQVQAAALDRQLLAFDWLEVIIEYLEESLSAFDWRRQSLRSYSDGQAMIDEVINLLNEIEQLPLQPIIRLLESVRTSLLTFLSILEERLARIQIDWRKVTGSRGAVFSAWARVWYWRTRAGTERGLKEYLTALTGLLYWKGRVENFAAVGEQVFGALEQILRASSAVECINSMLRPYLSVKKHLSQGFLALIALYWNMHPLPQRGGKTPFEESKVNLGSKDWIEVLGCQMRRMGMPALAI